ncbi:MAG TPA: acetamidase/formamidase family protein [Candidatus Aquilonibacter sp.]|nr:acetamidase/formamidase family protein [Candidatus Aquilonibacter sp.]
MRLKALVWFGAMAVMGVSAVSCAAQAASDVSGAKGPLTGKWQVTAEFHGTPMYAPLQLEQAGQKLTGNFHGEKLEGTVEKLEDGGVKLHFVAKDGEGDVDEGNATVADGEMKGEVVTSENGGTQHDRIPFTAELIKPIVRGNEMHEFVPTVFYRSWSPFNKPVLRVKPGDTIHTTTVDAGGTDEKGVRRVMGGNPATGPFYIEGAEPGDTLVVHIVRLKLNRDWAMSDDDVVSRATDTELAVRFKDAGKGVRWNLDRANGTASVAEPGEHMKGFSIPVRPMLGCVATAVGPPQAPPPTGDEGWYGGNMDFNEVGEGATVYLPVSNPGALLYFGDAHALQGDGELNGNALETSMDVTVQVDVIQGKHLNGPRVETADALIAMGLGGDLEDALRGATSNMADWLQDEYKLTASEQAEFLGVASEFHISEVADRNAGIVLKIKKADLAKLGR